MWVETTFSFQGTVVDTIGAWSTEHGIENDTRARKYQAVAEDASDQTIFHLLRNSRWREDSRVPPLGLKRNSETDPVGDRRCRDCDPAASAPYRRHRVPRYRCP